MSLIYSRQLLKRSLSELCHSIGFDRTSEVSMDILVDICERRFAQLFEQIRDDASVKEYFLLFSSLFEHQRDRREQFYQYLQQFPSSRAMEQQDNPYPLKKHNQIFLRIPTEHSQEINERDSNPQTEYLFHWLPLFPHQEKSLDASSRMIQSSHSIDEEKILPKNTSYHPLSSLALSDVNAEELTTKPMGKRPNRALPKVLFRPKRLIEHEANIAAMEKAKKELLDKENAEKDHHQGSQSATPAPLRLTIAKPPPPPHPVNQEKTSLTIKKPTASTPPVSVPPPPPPPPLPPSLPIVDSEKKSSISPALPTITLPPSLVKRDPTPSNEPPPPPPPQIVPPTIDPSIVLDLSKSSSFISPPPVSVPSKVPRLKLNIKNVPNPGSSLPTDSAGDSLPDKSTTKVNLKIRTSSVPQLGTNPNDEGATLISPPVLLPTSHIDEEQEKTKKKKKKKKHHHHRDDDEHREKKVKKEEPVPIPEPVLAPPTHNPEERAPGTIRLKIKLGKPTPPPPPPPPPPSAEPLRLTLPLPSSSHRRKPSQVKRIVPVEHSFEEELANSIDDLPLVERTSPTKTLLNPVVPDDTSLSLTPMKKKSTSIKKKVANIRLGVAVIEERRIHHDSQEKIWICPSCNRPDNGQEAMIACDLCDDWYHWECVGIVEEPAESKSWFCPKCHRSNSSTASAQAIKPSASSKAKRKKASALFLQKQQLPPID